MEKYKSIIKLIEENSDIINFAEFGQGVSDFWINKAQEQLNVLFPASYIWWLKNYSGGEILGEEIFSVYEKDNVVGGDIIYMNELNRRNRISDATQLIIQETDRSEIFYFDLTQPHKDGEFLVYRAFANIKTRYADDFLEFLTKRIKDQY